MRTFMNNQVTLCRKWHWTMRAFEWLLTSVNPLMIVQTVFLTESFCAKSACKWSLTSMNTDMLFQIAIPCKFLVAPRANERIICMHFLMRIQICLSLERFIAFGALILILSVLLLLNLPC